MTGINLVFFGKISVSLLNFLIFIFIAREMSVSDYGKYSLNLAFAGVINLLLFQFIRLAIVRFGINDELSLKKLYSLALYLFLLTIAVCFLFFLFDSDIFYFLLAGISLGIFEITQEINRAKEDNKAFIFNAFLRTIFFSISVILLYSFDLLTVTNTIFGFSIPYLTVAIIRLYRFRFLYEKTLELEFFYKFSLYSLPLVFSSGMTYIVDYFDRYYISELLTLDDLGVYSAVYTLSQQSVGVILMSLNIAFYPLIVKAFENRSADYKKYRSNYLSIIILFISVITLFSFFYGSEIINLLLGAAYAEGYLVFKIVIVSICIGCLKTYFVDIHYLLEKKTAFLFFNSILSALINILLNVFLIPAFGLVGAAYSTCITFLIAIVVSFVFSKKEALNYKPLYISLFYALLIYFTVCFLFFLNGSILFIPVEFEFILVGIFILVLTMIGFRKIVKY